MQKSSLNSSVRSAVARHKTAIGRSTLSRPIRRALEDGIITEECSIFDYGCGRGDDLWLLRSMGFEAAGWDPVHNPKAPVEAAAVVNLGYVVNVIEDPNERQEVLRKAWSLAEQVLIVSARLNAETKAISGSFEDLADGYLTSRGTFQKFFEQDELKNWIDQSLGVAPIPAAPGIFYVFRDDERRSSFAAGRYRRVIVVPRLVRSLELFEEHKDLLQPLIGFFGEHGRLPEENELKDDKQIRNVFGTVKRAWKIVEKATSQEQWNDITKKRAQDLLIYLALSRFDKRPVFSNLPESMQLDIKSFFSSYTTAYKLADELLFSVGNMEVIDKACSSSTIGKLTPEALYVHISALERLSPLLRVLEGCAKGYIGQVEEANIIKFHRHEPKISYLSYPDFENDPHPALRSSMGIHLQTFRIRFRDYRSYKNPPILHRKETFLAADHPLYEKFSRLTKLEEGKGLYEDTGRIGTRDGWTEVLGAKGLYLHGHRLLKIKDS
jgi:DNA phosphorothioation-associated putative methyltransferase